MLRNEFTLHGIARSNRGMQMGIAIVGAVVLMLSAPGAAADGASFTDVTTKAGIVYARTPSEHIAVQKKLMIDSLREPIGLTDMPSFPMSPRGKPGIAIFDFDGDGDLDLYVTNGPGSANSLFASQLEDSGVLRFVDMAAAAGVQAVDQDSTGVCFGDIDNDGDKDLFVLGRNDANRMYENRGDGTFTDITAYAAVAGAGLGSSSCSFGDVNADGLLDLAVANTFDWSSMQAIAVEPFSLNQHNELYLNRDGNVFADIGDSSGIRTNDVLPPGGAAISWGVTMVDYDQDGDTDVVFADDQALTPTGQNLDRGFIQVFANDGSGTFSATAVGTPGSWMGQAWADFDCNGQLDVFGSNFGDYGLPFMGLPYTLGEQSSRWLLGQSGGQLSDPGLGDMVASVFGWGAVAEDFDNDGDTDLAFHGGIDVTLMLEASNPGVLLLNDGCGSRFTLADAAFTIDHAARMVHGVATGDLDGDGFVDIVTVASEVASPPLPVLPIPITYGAPFDGLASFAPRFFESAPGTGEFIWAGFDFADGDLSIEINNGIGGYSSAAITVLGGVGITQEGSVNRDGIGAIIRFTPVRGSTAVKPVVGGTSLASAPDLTQLFGLGDAHRGTLDVLWPGGVRNRLYGVRAAEKVLMPEIPCSYDTEDPLWHYRRCVRRAIRDYVNAGVIRHGDGVRLGVSAVRAYREARERIN